MKTSRLRACSLLLSLFVMTLVCQSAMAIVYLVDDGTAESAFGTPAGGDPLTITFANHFNVVSGGETITRIGIAWGSTAGGGVNGIAMTAKLWSDPNGDGVPSDAVLLSSVAGTTSNANTDTFVFYDIPDTTLLIGQSFFVGATITFDGPAFPIALDITAPISNESWATSAAGFGPGFVPGPTNIGTSAFAADLMVRAEGIAAAAVPEPGSLTLLAIALGVFGLAVRKQARVRNMTRSGRSS